MEQKQSVRIRRVGTLTFGCMLLVFGILFLIRIFVPGLDYEIIFRCCTLYPDCSWNRGVGREL